MIKRTLFFLFLATLILASSCYDREAAYGFKDAQYYIPELDRYIAYSLKRDDGINRKLHVMLSRDSTFENINEVDHLVFGYLSYDNRFHITKYTDELYIDFGLEAEVKNSKHFIVKNAKNHPYLPPGYSFDLQMEAGRVKLTYCLSEDGKFTDRWDKRIIPDATLRRCDKVKLEERIEYNDIYGNKLYYEVLSKEEKSVALVYDTSYKMATEICIPSVIIHNDTTYIVREIGESAFVFCDSLKRITLSDSLDVIGSGAFCSCTSLRSLHSPGRVNYIGKRVFQDCENLESIQLPNSLKYIGEYCFENCISLKEITLPPLVEVIEHSTFLNCSSLENIILPDSLKKIKKFVFSDCISLQSIVIPPRVNYMASGVFSRCNNLCSIILEGNTPSNIIEFTFLDNINISPHVNRAPEWVGKENEFIIYVPDESLDLYKNHMRWGKMDIKPMSDLKK